MLYMFYNPIKHQIRVIISRLIKTSFHVLRLVQGHTKKEITSICSSNVKSVLADILPLSTNKLFHKFLIRFRFSDKLSLIMKINNKNFTPTLSNAAHLRNRMRSEVILCKSKWLVEQSRSVYT